MRYVFHSEAFTEYAEAVQHYTKQRVEVAQAFIDAVEDAVHRIRESPTRYIVIDEDIRRCMTRKFPYGIVYTSAWARTGCRGVTPAMGAPPPHPTFYHALVAP